MNKLNSIEKKTLLSITEITGVFKKSEIDILDEMLEECRINPKTSYVLFIEKKDGEISGFAIIGKTPCTLEAWDLYWLVVNKEHHGMGVALKIMKTIDAHMKSIDKDPVVRVETSSRDDYSRARAFYEKYGYTKTGIIPNFYAKNDDLVIYHK
ncbi:MAG: GNAT family N-acetyltransferase [Candidatus Omnitrophica bacterium]|nr:GNAT family N-acetyltransferase [Candidatus Omnitrophota bacterium]